MLSSIFKTIISRRDVKIFLTFCLLPFLIPVLSGNIETVNGNYTQSFLSFFQITLKTNYQLVLPTLIVSVIIASVFRDEIDSRILFLYKDINRKKIFNSKIFALFMVYGIMSVGTLLSSLAVYYGFIVSEYGASLRLIDINNLSNDLLMIIGIILLNLITIVLTAAVSIVTTSLKSVLVGALFNMFVMTAPLWVGLKYLSPISYIEILSNRGLLLRLLAVVGISAVYMIFSYCKGLKNFHKVEF